MNTAYRFPIFMLVSLVVVAGILTFVLRGRARAPERGRLWLVALIVGPGGMLVAKYGATIGLRWWLYYTIPLLLTLVVPVVAFRMKPREAVRYLLLAFLSAPAVHVLFSLTLDWREYMPFLPVP
ncbi:MAG: hypothetical protein JSW71_03220 [Gemmatimonadota bacterium]|nr:MAG: hypothetical protein JSW71_03220 [Gemmatimonadota bacterium]